MFIPSRLRVPVQYFSKRINSVADPDPGSGAFLTPWIRDLGPGMSKKSGSGSGMNNTDHINKSLETIFWVKILKFFDADPETGIEKMKIKYPGCQKFGSMIRNKHPGSAKRRCEGL